MFTRVYSSLSVLVGSPNMENKKVIKVYSEQTHDVVAETVLPDAGDEIDEGHLVRCLV